MLVGGPEREYAVIYEKGPTSWGAHVPDLPVGDSLEEVQKLIKEIIELYVETLKEEGKPVPEPVTDVGKIRVAA